MSNLPEEILSQTRYDFNGEYYLKWNDVKDVLERYMFIKPDDQQCMTCSGPVIKTMKLCYECRNRKYSWHSEKRKV
jgi:hypothetical protein